MTASSAIDVSTMSLRFKMMSVTSSATPAIVSNSWSASSKRTVVMAAPGIDESRVRRSELPMRVAEAGLERADGETLTVVRLLAEASTVGRWMTSMWCQAFQTACGLRITWSTARR